MSDLATDGEGDVGYRQVGSLVIPEDPAELDAVEQRLASRRAEAPEMGVVQRLPPARAAALISRSLKCAMPPVTLKVAIERRSWSASPGVKPAQTIATCIACSWNSGSYVAGVKPITTWFSTRERGRAMGVFMTASSLAVVLTNLIVPLLLADAGWQGVYHWLGLVTACLGIVALIVVRDGPASAPCGAPGASPSGRAP